MVRDINPMPSWNTVCPCCGNKVVMEWQMAIDYGSDCPQFIRLRKDDKGDSCDEKLY